MLQKNVKSLVEQLKVCICAEIVFGVRCTLRCRVIFGYFEKSIETFRYTKSKEIGVMCMKTKILVIWLNEKLAGTN